MSVQAIGAPVQAARPRTRPRLEHFVMGGAILCLIVLVVLPLMSLLIGSLRGEQGLSLDNFKEVASGRLYVNALKNSLILGAWTGLFSLILGVALAWAVSPHRRARQGADAGDREPVLPLAAVPHRHCLRLPVQSRTPA